MAGYTFASCKCLQRCSNMSSNEALYYYMAVWHQLHANGSGCMTLSHLTQHKLPSIMRVHCEWMIGGSCHLGALYRVAASNHAHRHDSRHDDSNSNCRPSSHDDRPTRGFRPGIMEINILFVSTVGSLDIALLTALKSSPFKRNFKV